MSSTGTRNRRGTGKVKRLFTWFGGVFSLALVVIIFSYVPLREIWQSLLLVKPLFVVLAIFSVVVGLFLRGYRWAWLFSPDYTVSTLSASAPIVIGLTVNTVLPAKAGEFVRILLGARRFKTGFTFSAFTVISDRMLDGLTLLFMLGASLMLLSGHSPGIQENFTNTAISTETLFQVFRSLSAISLVLLLIVISLMFSRTRSVMVRAIRRMPFFGDRTGDYAERIIGRAGDSLKAFRDKSVFFRLLASSILIWLSIVVCYSSVGLGLEGINVNFFQAMVITAISIAAASVPSVPGAWGVFEAGVILGIKLLGIRCEMSTAVAYALLVHLSMILPVVLCGIIAMIANQISLSELNVFIQSSGRQQSWKDRHREGNGPDGSS